MTQNLTTEQEIFWAGEFGDEYITRNQGNNAIARNVALFAKILSRAKGIHSVLELGANIGLNLQAIKQLLPEAEFSAVEINSKAIEQLKAISYIQTYHQSVLDFEPALRYDLTFIKGVLIHINPDFLTKVYDLLYKASSRYICIAEYYNTTPVEVTYRGHQEKLFKRDFAGEILNRFTDLELLDYSFVYHRDRQFPQDDITWFLLEKTG